METFVDYFNRVAHYEWSVVLVELLLIGLVVWWVVDFLEGTRGERLFEGTILTVKYFLDSLNVKLVDQLLIRGVDKKGEIKEHPDALARALELGRRLVLAGAGTGE